MKSFLEWLSEPGRQPREPQGYWASVDARSAILLLIGLAKNWYLSIICRPYNPLCWVLTSSPGMEEDSSYSQRLILFICFCFTWSLWCGGKNEILSFFLVKESLSSYLVRPYLIRLLELLGNPLFLALYTFFSRGQRSKRPSISRRSLSLSARVEPLFYL